LLDRCLSPRAGDDDILPLACALARQCFLNEYVFACSEGETERLARLTASLAAALSAGQPTSPLQLAVVAAYASLDSVLPTEALLARDWPRPLKDVLVRQVEEPATERRLRAAIPRLTPIKDSVSRAVQAQYEDHPYPRWTFSSAKVPSWAPFASAREILIAGCGTGRQLCEMASLNTSAHVLAVDLSLASLSYATRKAQELGLKNVEIAQADILELGSLGRSFDFIDSSGVLHHLGDPWAGWRVLLSLLRPQGAMRVALYSELARRPLVAARAFIAERGYSGSTEDIRRFRQDALAAPDLAIPTGSHDFYTISSCRDLLFHVQETRMTLPEIKAFLAQNGLEFLGFDIASTALEAFRNRFPHAGAHTDLDCWHLFEQEWPSVFVGMYQFDVKKR
jgi:2-polyprenyl-3-methyl-5-hydroxy-6-metoxy-1,4-benzoquinol methylase